MDLGQDAAAVVARAAGGDREAWAVIWDAHGPALHRYAQRLLRDEHDAGDAVADTFVSAAEHLDELRDPALLRPWLYAICRRHVQRRWQARDRVRPFEADVLAAVVDAEQVDVSPTGSLDAAEAAALLWAAAEGMGPADRELLHLVLSADLESGDVAALTGEAPAAVYVRVSRLKDALGRSAGALLVARHHREDCAGLDALLAPWDGVYAPLWRKRIARHVDDCDVCGSSRQGAAAGLFSLAGLAPLAATPLLRDRAVGGAVQTALGDVALVSARTDLVFGADGFPVAQAWEQPTVRRRRSFLLAAAAALLLTTAGGAVAVAVQAEAPTAPVAVAATSGVALVPTTPSVAVLPSVTVGPLPTAPLPTAARPTAASVTAPPRAAATTVPAVAAPMPSRVVPTTAPATVAPLPAPPTVALRLSETAISTACGAPTTSVATATAALGSGGLRTRISWDGTAPGGQDFGGEGAHAAVVGPYSSTVAVQDTVTVTAVVTDALGRTATAARTLTVDLAPC